MDDSVKMLMLFTYLFFRFSSFRSRYKHFAYTFLILFAASTLYFSRFVV